MKLIISPTEQRWLNASRAPSVNKQIIAEQQRANSVKLVSTVKTVLNVIVDSTGLVMILTPPSGAFFCLFVPFFFLETKVRQTDIYFF